MKSKSEQSLNSRHIPQRTCVACLRTRSKRELFRLVCTESGIVEVDPSGKKAGRGAYLCPTKICWETGLKKSRLNRALRTELTRENKMELIEFSKRFPELLSEELVGEEPGW